MSGLKNTGRRGTRNFKGLKWPAELLCFGGFFSVWHAKLVQTMKTFKKQAAPATGQCNRREEWVILKSVWFSHGVMDAALGTRTLLWFGHGCFGHCMLLEHERNYGMLLEHERNYGLGMDALVTVSSWNTNRIRIMVWAWMLWSPYALGTRTK